MITASPLLLAALAAALAGVLAVEIAAAPDAGDDGAIPHVRAAPQAAIPAPVPAGAARAPERLVATTLARPLFEPERRPQAAGATPVASAPAARPPRLAGTMISPLGRRAIFVASEGARPVTLGEGDRLDRWTVSEIADGAVTLTSVQGPLRLSPAFGPRAPASAAPASPIPGMQPQVWRPQPDPAGVASSVPVTQ